MSDQTKNNNFDYLIDPILNKVNRLFVLSFENKDNRKSHEKYYTPTIEIKGYNVLIDGRTFFDIPLKYKEEAYRKIADRLQ